MARRSDHTRDQLKEMALQAAEELLTEKPVNELSTRQIASKMGYTVGTLYQIFDNLPDLLLHVNLRTLRELYGQCLAVRTTDADGITNIQAFGETYIRYAVEHPGRWSLVFDRHLIGMENLPDWYIEQVSALFELLELELRKIDPKASDASVMEASRALWCSVHGICMLTLSNNLFARQGPDTHSLARSLIQHYLQGWKTA